MKIPLSSVVAEVTAKCNLECNFCYNHYKRPGENPPEEYGYADIKKVLRKLFRQTELRHVSFSGGEPTLHPRFCELVLYARLKGAKVTVISNGTAPHQTYKTLIDIGVSLFELPFHSIDADIHNLMTGNPDSHRRSFESMEFITSNGGKVVAVIVVTKYNYNTVYDTLKYLSDKGYKRVMLNRYNIGGRNVNNPERVSASKSQLNTAYEQAEKASRDFDIKLSSNVCTPYCVLNPEKFPHIIFTSCSPDLTRRPVAIGADGSLRFCNHSPVISGNILKTKFIDIIESQGEDYKQFKIPKRCENCELYVKCGAGCRAAAQQSGQTMGDVDPIIDIMN